ncbi:hypothetical protein J7E45_08325 [Microbacterium sp. ISL-59]|uniref:Qat anti-phage system associated protein QatB n=1 Tax=Microbacterium sp. ISL-59 TaxID=2819159 RepID=UPI001BEABE7A|nr:Qat anti-phage system associated protein QatB [Microbacterium sp. ISL-59]MBT2495611.1 hypothetical protein [Microbacterium sp. ISL-59]
MGTSQSSEGPGPGVALVPPWADDVDETSDEAERDEVAPEEAAETKPVPVAPAGRFRDSRTALGRFARSGNSQDLRRALRHYVQSGYGGSGTMTRRLGGTAATAGRLSTVLQSAGTVDGTDLRDRILANGSDANAVLDAIVDATSPADGTQDREAGRIAVRNALSALLERYPNADLLALEDAQRVFVIERYAALDVFGRLCLDLQKTVMNKSPDATIGLRRLRYIREFITEQVSAAFRRLEANGDRANSARVAQITRDALRETLTVFEEYTE